MARDTNAPLDQYLKPIKDHATLIGAVTAAVTLLGVLASTMVPTSYQSTASVLVTPISADPTEVFEPDVVVDMPTEERIATSTTVVGLVSTRLAEQSIDIDDDALAQNVTVATPKDSRILDVSFEAATPSLARTGADTFARTYLDYRSQLANENRAATVDALQERIAVLKDQLAGIEGELTRYEEGSQSFVTLSVERESIKSELDAQQEALASLSTLSIDVGRIISPGGLPDSPRGLGAFVIILGAAVGGLVLGCIAAFVLAAIKAANAPRNRRSTDVTDRADGGPGRPDPTPATTPYTAPTAVNPATTAAVTPARSDQTPNERPPAAPRPTSPERTTLEPVAPAPPTSPPAESRSPVQPLLQPASPAPTARPAPSSTEGSPALARTIVDGLDQPRPGVDLHREPTKAIADGGADETWSAADRAQEQAMDAFFGPEPVSGTDSTGGGSTGTDPTYADRASSDPASESATGTATDPGSTDRTDTDPPLEGPDTEWRAGFLYPGTLPAPDELGDSLDTVAAETGAALAAMLERASPDLAPVRGSDIGVQPPESPIGAGVEPGVDPLMASWEIDENVDSRWQSDIHAPVDVGEVDVGEGDTGRRYMGKGDLGEGDIAPDHHRVRSETPPPPPTPPTAPTPIPLPEADFEPLLQRLRRIGQGRAVSCLCLGEVSRDASLAVGFALADELQALGVTVLVVDMLLEEPALDRLLGLPPSPGLLDILAEQIRFDDAARPVNGVDDMRAMTIGDPDELADRRRVDELINGWSMRRMLDDASARFHATIIVGGMLADADRLDLVARHTDGIVVGTEQTVGDPPDPLVAERLAPLPAQVLALISLDAALPPTRPAADGAPSR